MNVSHRSILVWFLLIALLAQVVPVSAAEGGVVHLNVLDTAHFPTIEFQMDVYDANGQYVQQLSPERVKIIENGRAIQPDTIDPIKNGLQIILAINTGPVLARQTAGVTEYQRIQSALLDWARQQPQSTVNDYSLATPTGLHTIRSRQPEEFINALAGFQPDLQTNQPTLNSLAEALDLATDPLNTPAMKRSILYITPPLEGVNQAPLADLTSRAREIGVRVNVWIVQPEGAGVNASAGGVPVTGEEGQAEAPATLQTLAQATGGQYVEVLATAPLPDIESFFAPQRTSYRVQYTSLAQNSGTHELVVHVDLGEAELASESQSYSLTVQPPNPIFLSPPAVIERKWTAPAKNKEPVLIPGEVPLQILVEFPDQHHRDLTVTRLYLDNQLVDENTSPPFDRFSLPVQLIETTSSHSIRVEAVDILNLSGSSMDVPVDVVVAQPAKASLFENLSKRGMIAIGAMAVSGLALALVLVLTSSHRWVRRKNQSLDRKRMKDPVTQPVQIRQEKARKEKKPGSKASGSHPTWPPAAWHSGSWPRPSTPNAPARLVSLDDNEQPITGGVLLLSRQEITFGSDPRRATHVLDSPTVADLHARLYRNDEGQFILCDQNSIAGTWINYAPVTSTGSLLEHGDLIHIGKVQFRFEITDPSKIPAADIKVVHLEKRP